MASTFGVPLKHREPTIGNEQNAARAVLDTGQFNLGVAADDRSPASNNGINWSTSLRISAGASRESNFFKGVIASGSPANGLAFTRGRS